VHETRGRGRAPFTKKETTKRPTLACDPNAVLDDRAPAFCTLVRPQQVPGTLAKDASKMPAEMRLVVKTRFGRDVR
jgi:hypothetical protein